MQGITLSHALLRFHFHGVMKTLTQGNSVQKKDARPGILFSHPSMKIILEREIESAHCSERLKNEN